MTTIAPQHHTPKELFISPDAWVDMDRWHAEVAEVRRAGALQMITPGIGGDLAVVTRMATLLEVSRNHEVWANSGNPVINPRLDEAASSSEAPLEMKMLINQDGPEHLQLRKLVVDWFKKSTLKILQPAVDELVAESMQRLRDLDGECDFAVEVALPLPLRVIMSMLGVPREDEPLLLKLTQEMFSAEDSELGSGDPLTAMMEVAGYFNGIIEDRQANPTDDLSSAIANGFVDEQPIELLSALGLYVIIATAGHDTTSFAMAGGVHALTRYPEQFDILRADRSLLETAAHEAVRWTSPVRHFTRTATRDTTLEGQDFAAGDRVFLSYPAANRDPEVFQDPDALQVDRKNANRHVGWGHGPHYCLGARLAQMEIMAVLDGLCSAATRIEATGPEQWTRSMFVGGVKHAPIKLHY